MSINSAMLAGVSGLVTNSSALAAISDNIANVNTTAYKRKQVNFANVVTSQAVKGRYSAGGVQGVTRQFVSTQGLIQSATSATDLGIAGDGFFVVSTKGAGMQPGDPRMFTRSGSFSVDADGYLTNDANLYLQGWPIAEDGTINASPSDLTRMGSINVKNLGGAVRATENVVVNANVDKTQVVSGAEATYVPGEMAAYAATGVASATATQPDFDKLEMNIVDSSGGTHRIKVAMLKSDTPANTWHAEIYAVPASDIVGGTDGLITSGMINFNPDGTINLTASGGTTLFGAAGSAPTLNIGASTDAAGVRWASGLGIEASTINLDLSKLTQYADTSAVNSVNPDGATVGNVVGVEVDKNGVVSATFDNNEVRKIAQIGLATFPNSDGLLAISGNAYQQTIQSGEFAVKAPGTAGAGEIAAGALEASSVDLSAEFTGLITTQKAYSASSKIITTADQMLEELINIKR